MSQQKTTAKTYTAIFSVALMTFLGVLNETSMNVTYPELSRTFGISLDITQWITAGYLLMVTIVMGTTAYLLRQYPAKRIHLFCVTAFIVGDIVCALAPSFAVLLTGRLIQAVATGLATPTMFFLIFTSIPRRQLATMTGIGAMVISLAPALGPTYGGAVAGAWSWRMIFWILLPIAIISLLAGQWSISNQPVGNKKPFSFASLLCLALALVGIVYAVSTVGAGFSSRFWIFLVLGLAFFDLFVYSNSHGKSQLLGLEILQLTPMRLSTFTYFALQFINIGISLVIPVYCQYVLHTSALVAGLVLLPGSIAGAITSPLMGRVADQYGYHLPVVGGSILLVLGTGMYAVFQHQLTPMMMMWFFVATRVGFNSAFSTTMANATTLVPAQQSADVNSLFNMTQQFAGSLGVVLLTALMALFQNTGHGSMAARTFVGGQLDFWLLFGLAVAVLVATATNFTIQRLDEQAGLTN